MAHVNGTQTSFHRKAVIASALLASLGTLPVYASTMVLEFSGTLGSLNIMGTDPTNGAKVGHPVSGRFKIGLDNIPSNSSNYPSQGAYQTSSYSWITTEIDGFGFDVTRGVAENPGGNYLDLVNKVNDSPFVSGFDGLHLVDEYVSGSAGRICSGTVNFCGKFSLDNAKPSSDVIYFEPGMFSDTKLPFNLNLGQSDFLDALGGPTVAQVTFQYLSRFDGVYQYAQGNIALNKLTASVAPVPLPASAFLFLTAIGGFAGLKLRKRHTRNRV